MFEEIAEGIGRFFGNGEGGFTNGGNHNGNNHIIRDIIDHTIANGIQGDYNQYPSDDEGKCCQKAIFIALRQAFPGGITANGAFKYAIEKFIQHMIRCGNITKSTCIITESWDLKFFAKWEGSIRSLCTQYGATLEVYFIVNGTAHKIMQINP